MSETPSVCNTRNTTILAELQNCREAYTREIGEPPYTIRLCKKHKQAVDGALATKDKMRAFMAQTRREMCLICRYSSPID